ncbi:hypothetical protein GOBAR_AA27507 [Gossypium barbadense]|uniref:Uncharacterized protein n=1 Tax=Gossypium barbadense TaxID=3634 RepID=A0A2P5WQ28_GOSBA|nr:hypothetical protein GOBAR_AA27507 [Gossypium barbadense]
MEIFLDSQIRDIKELLLYAVAVEVVANNAACVAGDARPVLRYNALAASAWQDGNEGRGSREEKVIRYWLTLVSGLAAERVYGTTKLCDYAILGDGDRRREGVFPLPLKLWLAFPDLGVLTPGVARAFILYRAK